MLLILLLPWIHLGIDLLHVSGHLPLEVLHLLELLILELLFLLFFFLFPLLDVLSEEIGDLFLND